MRDTKGKYVTLEYPNGVKPIDFEGSITEGMRRFVWFDDSHYVMVLIHDRDGIFIESRKMNKRSGRRYFRMLRRWGMVQTDKPVLRNLDTLPSVAVARLKAS